MSILVYGEKATRTHENQMLQSFLEQLEDRWYASEDWIFVIANSMWNGAEIDLVCILPSAIIVADFKNNGGRLTGTENGPWQADSVLVKGGSKDNPFQQLRDNKFSVMNWLNSKSLLPGRNLGHISASVVFSGRVTDQVELPSRARSWFYPTDLDTCANLLDSLASPELKIVKAEAADIVQRLGVQPVVWKSRRPSMRVIDSVSAQSAGCTQTEALQALCNFLSSDDLVTFSVLGMTSTGKSHLLNEMVPEIRRIGKTPVVLSPNQRLAVGALAEAQSIYTHIYGGSEVESENEGVIAGQEKARVDVISLRTCEDDLDTVYLVDDAHLLGNSRFITPDGKQYGSGYLLDDFHAFTELGKTGRKVIYFGDPYQIQRSGENESALKGTLQQSQGLSHGSLELNHLIDTTNGSAKLANAERLVKAIRSKRFAQLDLLADGSFRRADKIEAAAEMLDRYHSDPFSIWYLAETHAKTNLFTQWLRERLHNKKSLESIEPGEVLEIYTAPDVWNPIEPNASMQSGDRVSLADVGDRTEYSQGLSWAKSNPVKFHSIACQTADRHETQINVFEEFLTADKPELDKETAAAERVWREKLNAARRKALNQQGQLPGVQPLEIPAPAIKLLYGRYGYATTVHHAQGMSQRICYVNCDLAAGRHSEGYFRWLYSALTVAKRELVLVNFTDIHPFDTAVWKLGTATIEANIPVGAGWSFDPDGIASEKDQRRSQPPGLDQSKDFLKSVAIWLRVANAAEKCGWSVVQAVCHAYQEQYDLVGPNGEQCRLRVPYNGRNIVTSLHINDPAYWPFLVDLASDCLDAESFTPEAEGLLRSLRSRLHKEWKVVSSTETAYRLAITLVRGHNERVAIEVNFDKQGLASTVRGLQTSEAALLEEIKGAML